MQRQLAAGIAAGMAFLHAQPKPVLHHDLFTNGIAYVDVGFDLRSLPADYLPYVNRFGRAITEMGTA